MWMFPVWGHLYILWEFKFSLIERTFCLSVLHEEELSMSNTYNLEKVYWNFEGILRVMESSKTRELVERLAASPQTQSRQEKKGSLSLYKSSHVCIFWSGLTRFILWTWPREIGVAWTTLKMPYVIYLSIATFFIIITIVKESGLIN